MIYKTTKEKFNAVIKEIVRLHEEGRPVLVGTTAVDISEKLSLMLKMQGIQHNVLNAKLHQKEAEIVAKAGQRGAVTIATNMAGRGTDIKLTDEVKALGGLAIIGTERHESRRVDRQLRGRAGRQGDPGSSQFFVSLEDKLMRLFGGEKMIKFMDRFGLQEGEELQNSMLTSSIEKAQRKVEENNFGMRKRLLEYDDVMNSQREVVYTRRRHALFGERLDVDIDNMMQDSAYAQIADAKQADASYESLRLDVLKNFTTQLPFDEDEYHHGKVEDLARKLYDAATESFKLRKQVIVEQAYPVIEQVFTEQGDKYKNIVLPITNGMLTYNILINLKEAYETKGQSLIVNAEKAFLLLTIDDQWRDHLRQMDELRKSVQNATYEQKDPLLIYKFESFNLFKTMIETINRLSVQSMTRLSIPVQARDPEEERRMQEEHRRQMEAELARRRLEVERLRAMREASQSQQQPQQVVSKQKVGRNDPCPCGSGKKYKNCHGKGLEE